MGVGSWLSRYFERQLPAHFLRIELLVALIGGALPATLFLANANTPGAFRFLLYGMVLMVGTLVGLEIPLVMRILKRNTVLKDLVSQVLTFDYLGALAVSLAFPLLLVPQLGLIRTGLLFGLMNAAVALWAVWLFRGELRRLRAHAVACVLVSEGNLSMGDAFSEIAASRARRARTSPLPKTPRSPNPALVARMLVVILLLEEALPVLLLLCSPSPPPSASASPS
jgi:predicted membrane-bound spermidine synthase